MTSPGFPQFPAESAADADVAPLLPGEVTNEFDKEAPLRRAAERRRPRVLVHVVMGLMIGLLVGAVDAWTAISGEGLAELPGASGAAGVYLSVALIMALGLGLGVVSGVALWLAGRWFTPTEARRFFFGTLKGRIILGSLALFTFGVMVGFVVAKDIEWDAVDFRLPLYLLVGGLVWLFGAWFVHAASRWLLLAISLAGLAFLCLSALAWHANEDATGAGLERVATETSLARLVLFAVRPLADGDGDGFPRLLCRSDCDCDDADPEVSPGAQDVPGNGVDEDCDGVDASKAVADRYAALLARKPKPKPKPKPTPKPPAQPVERPPQPDAVPSPAAAPPAPDAGPDDADPFMKLSRPGPPSILLIVVDTLRADHVGCLGYERPTTPRLDALCGRSVVFEQARATGPATRFSIPPMLAGKYFTEINRSEGHWTRIQPEEVLMAERLQAAGYYTAAVHSITYLRGFYGFDQGFDHYDDSPTRKRKPLHEGTSDMVTDQVLAHADEKALATRKEPWLLWAYYGDPHSPYVFHKDFPRFGPSMRDIYDNEIAFADHHVGRLLDGLEERGLLKDTLIVFTSDHGEALDPKHDHGHKYHSANLYDELIRVPLLVAGPGIEPRRVQTPVSLLDVLPTFMELASIDEDPNQRGVSLVPWLQGEDAEHPPLFFEKHRKTDAEQKGLLLWPYKLHMTLPFKRYRVYDLEQDPGETQDIFKTMPAEDRERLVGLMAHWRTNVLKPHKLKQRN